MPEQRKLIWKSSNNFGIKSIDQQHESLIAIVNNLFDEALSDSSKKCINKIFISLEEYVSEHFRHEEMLFERYNWYEKDEHKIQHQLLEKKLSAFKEEIFDECSQQQLVEFIEFLKEWIELHTLKQDLNYVEFLKARGAI